jgi:nicotinamide-nucleotide amidase
MTANQHVVEEIADLARQHAFDVSVAESLTSGQIATALGAGPEASSWFRGGVVAYATEVKQTVLGVRPGPVVTAECARDMAAGVAALLGADAAVSVTGVGGPDAEEGEPPGTVYVATIVRGHEGVVRLDLDGDPEEVLARTTAHALEMLRGAMGSAGALSAPPRPDTARDGAPAG